MLPFKRHAAVVCIISFHSQKITCIYFPSSLWITFSDSTLLLLSLCEKLSKVSETFEKQKHWETRESQFLKCQLRCRTVMISVVICSIILLRGWVRFFSLCVPWLTEHLIKCVEKEEKRGRRLAIKAVLVLQWDASSSVRNTSWAKQKS